MSSQPPPPRTFSKGTMGLKFMQRVVASQAPSQSTSPSTSANANKPTTNPSASRQTGSVLVGQGRKGGVGVKKEQREETTTATPSTSTNEHEQNDQVWQGATTTSSGTMMGTHGRKKRRLITTSGSLLHFPSIREQHSSPLVTSSTSRSTPPLMARWSFGGANEEIEQLTNPSAARASSQAKEEKSLKDKSKDRKKNQTQTASHFAPFLSGTTSIRRNDSKAVKNQNQKKRAYEKVEARDVAEQKLEDGEGMSFTGAAELELEPGFRKPAGMEGVKKGSLAGRPSLERKRRKADEKDEEVVWGKRGDERAWDVGKVLEDGSEEDESDDDSDASVGSSESCEEE